MKTQGRVVLVHTVLFVSIYKCINVYIIITYVQILVQSVLSSNNTRKLRKRPYYAFCRKKLKNLQWLVVGLLRFD